MTTSIDCGFKYCSFVPLIMISHLVQSQRKQAPLCCCKAETNQWTVIFKTKLKSHRFIKVLCVVQVDQRNEENKQQENVPAFSKSLLSKESYEILPRDQYTTYRLWYTVLIAFAAETNTRGLYFSVVFQCRSQVRTRC